MLRTILPSASMALIVSLSSLACGGHKGGGKKDEPAKQSESTQGSCAWADPTAPGLTSCFETRESDADLRGACSVVSGTWSTSACDPALYSRRCENVTKESINHGPGREVHYTHYYQSGSTMACPGQETKLDGGAPSTQPALEGEPKPGDTPSEPQNTDAEAGQLLVTGKATQIVGPQQAIQPVTFSFGLGAPEERRYALENDTCQAFQLDPLNGTVTGTSPWPKDGEDLTCSADVVMTAPARQALGKVSFTVPATFRRWCEAAYRKRLTTRAQAVTIKAVMLDIYTRYLARNFVQLTGNESDCPVWQKTIDQPPAGMALQLILYPDSPTRKQIKNPGLWEKISDLGPLAAIPGLTLLDLSSNDVSDLTPLARQTKLELLRLMNNKVTNLAPLTALTQLRTLILDQNAIQDVAPLASLPQLWWLSLNHNHISDVSPLANLKKLLYLGLSRNRLADVSPLKDFNYVMLTLDGNLFDTEGLQRTEQNCPTTGTGSALTSFCREAR